MNVHLLIGWKWEKMGERKNAVRAADGGMWALLIWTARVSKCQGSQQTQTASWEVGNTGKVLPAWCS